MTTLARPLIALALVLGTGLALAPSPASAQAAKEPTDGFFDLPPSTDPDAGKGSSVPGYLITSMLGGAALFVMCKSARR